MLHPSYNELIDVANEGLEPGEQPVVQSRYSIVIATAKRARQLVNGDSPMVEVKEDERGVEKPLSIAIDEIQQRKVVILSEDRRPEDDINVQ